MPTDRHGERIKAAMRARKGQGYYDTHTRCCRPPGRYAPIGYRRVRRGYSRFGRPVWVLERAPEELEAIAYIVRWRLENYSWGTIHKHLRDLGIKTAEGKEWTVNRIRGVFRGWHRQLPEAVSIVLKEAVMMTNNPLATDDNPLAWYVSKSDRGLIDLRETLRACLDLLESRTWAWSQVAQLLHAASRKATALNLTQRRFMLRVERMADADPKIRQMVEWLRGWAKNVANSN